MTIRLCPECGKIVEEWVVDGKVVYLKQLTPRIYHTCEEAQL